MIIIRLSLLLFLMTVSFTMLLSQAEETDTSYIDSNARLIEASFDINSPLGNFNTSLDRGAIYGASFAFYMEREAETYSFYGFHFSYGHLGSLTNTITSQFIPFEDRTVSNFLTAQFVYRYYTPFYLSKVEPFVEARLGPNFFYTSTSTTFLDGSAETDFFFNETDFGLSYALAIGANISFAESFFGTLKFGYSGGTATSYLVPSDQIRQEFPIDNFTRETNPINYLGVSLGIGISL